MSTESTIGIVSGILGIAGTIYSVIKWVIRQNKEGSATELFNQLTDKNKSDAEHRHVLKKLNSHSLINKRIKDDYIKNFVLARRGKEEVLFDICHSNDIEPTEDICKGLLGYFSSVTKTKYKNEVKDSEQSLLNAIPTSDMNKTNETLDIKEEQIVYVSELLKSRYPETYGRLINILEKHDVKYNSLKGTKDIWCRDYMPVQTKSGKLIQFKYDPSYLKGDPKLEESRSDVKEVCRTNGINAQFSNINLDGGNVLICDDRAILTDRIFSENPDWDKTKLINELSSLLGCEIIIIPALKSKEEDFTGHADGMVRFVDRNTILGNSLAKEYKYIQEGMQKVIDKFGLKYIDVPFFETKDKNHPDSAIGIYVNFLEVNRLIVLPIFGREEDNQARDIIQKAFPDRVIETINYDDIAKKGGLLNCTTWVVNKSVCSEINNGGQV